MTLPPEYAYYAKALVGILVIVNPMGAIPIFLSLCEGRPLPQCRQIAKTSSIAVAVILLVAAWGGELILDLFGIGIPAFRTGGGLLILLMAIAMLHARQSQARQTPAEQQEATLRENIAIVPLAIPLMAGPGAISLVIVDAHQLSDWIGRSVLSGGILLVAGLVWICLRLAAPIGKQLGITGLNLSTRIMGLLLTAIGIQMIANGLTQLLPGLAGG